MRRILRKRKKGKPDQYNFDALLERGVIPVVNENDSVSYAEIESEERLFGDNDMLSAVVAVLCRARELVIFGYQRTLRPRSPAASDASALPGRTDR